MIVRTGVGNAVQSARVTRKLMVVAGSVLRVDGADRMSLVNKFHGQLYRIGSLAEVGMGTPREQANKVQTLQEGLAHGRSRIRA